MYIIPTFQNPTGVTLSLERRKALAELANRYGVILAEDDPYRDLRYAASRCPPSSRSTRAAGSCIWRAFPS